MNRLDPLRADMLVYRGPEIIVRHVPGSGLDLYVTFSHLNGHFPHDPPGFGEHFLREAGMPALHVIARRNHWWQPRDVDAALAAVGNSGILDRYATRVGYGSSMGGYGALLFSRDFRLDRVVAICPQVSVDPRQVPWETRYRNWLAETEFTRPDLFDVVSRTADILVVFDPGTSLDERHWRELSRLPRARALRLPYTGHPPLTFLQDVGLTGRFARDMLAGTTDLSAWRRLRRERRRDSSTYWLQLGIGALARNRAALAVAAAHRCLALRPRTGDAYCLLGQAHERLGERQLALAAFSAATFIDPEHPTYAYFARRMIEA